MAAIKFSVEKIQRNSRTIHWRGQFGILGVDTSSNPAADERLHPVGFRLQAVSVS